MFKTNVGKPDRLLRIALGVILLAAFFLFPESPWRYVGLIGIVPLATGLFGSCLVYSLLGLSTRAESKP